MALKQLYTNAYSKDFNNASKELALGITALIPYAGVIISPLLGLLWPENTSDSQMKQVEQKIEERIKGYDLSAIKSDYKTLLGLQQKFEKSMIEKNINKDTRRNDAINVDNKFESLINDCAKEPKLEEAELPLYTMIAAAHLVFLQSMQQEQIRLDANIDGGTFNSHFDTFTEKAKKYRDHIKETYDKKYKHVIKEITNIGEKHRIKIDENNYTNILQHKIKDLHGYIRTLGDRSGAWTREVDQLQKDLDTCNDLSNDLRDFYNKTWGNKAFQLTAKLDVWIEESGRWFRYDGDGKMKTGWFKSGDNWYYLSPEKTDKLEKGQMVTGWLEDDGNWYFLATNDQFFGPKGYMVKNMKIWAILKRSVRIKVLSTKVGAELTRIGWFQNNGEWYYFEKNGTLKRGWLQDGGKWYYLRESDGSMFTNNLLTTNDGKIYCFGKDGIMKIGWTNFYAQWFYFEKDGSAKLGWFQDKGKWYYFCPEFQAVPGYGKGQMLLDTTQKIKTANGQYKEFHFNASGVCTNP
ncbi:insecticidal delta-endotoxin Cry8Ea1 family protein [Bacillus cereus group sp. BfR-BA-01392]|uniref:insecticidal delta-endotoxin Cry8Ea1 family protein n=1 Tax=Bacillus cereus group sp. BfR-BA-01392 TaxID=2920329 RepID=UPI001F587675|nr:insecticidal delta-endotoxin Cry8Ea1 family protein [Bacillus cereus group sp. BfR-BA-01392]